MNSVFVAAILVFVMLKCQSMFGQNHRYCLPTPIQLKQYNRQKSIIDLQYMSNPGTYVHNNSRIKIKYCASMLQGPQLSSFAYSSDNYHPD